MKKLAYILWAGFFLMLIIGFAFFAKMLMNGRPNNAPVANTTTATVIVNLLPTATSISTTSTSLPDYEVLSPDKIKKDNLIFDVVAGLYTCAELQVEVQGIFPPDYKFPSTSLDVEGRGLYIFDDLKITTSSPKISLKLDPSFGGGGSSNINNSYVLGQDQSYVITPPLSIGQELRITAVVTFNKLFNIAQPVPFDLDVVAKQCP